MIMTLEPVDDSSVAKNKRVLVAEDHPVNSKLIETFLRNFGADVFLAEDGQQAIEQLLASDIDTQIKWYTANKLISGKLEAKDVAITSFQEAATK